MGQLYPIRTLSVGLAKCVVFSGEIILRFSYTVFRYVRYTGIRDPFLGALQSTVSSSQSKSKSKFIPVVEVEDHQG